jgi:hypothetical protein
MAIATETVYDTIGANVARLPEGARAAGYVTGAGDVPWTAEELKAHPGVVLIDQTPAGGPWDSGADVDDYENGAVQLSELAPRARLRAASFKAGTRPGQRHPAVYASAANLTAVCNALVAGGLTGIGLWVAHWGLPEATAAAMVANASGPFPVIGVQYDHDAARGVDVSVFSAPWLATVSVKPVQRVATGFTVHFADGTSELLAI